MVIMVVGMIMIMMVRTAGIVSIGVKGFDADRLLRHIGKLGDEIDYLVLE